MSGDWFRKHSWSDVDREDFWRGLSRAREHNRCQYVFIQGHTLMEAGAQYTAAAIDLFDHVIENYSHTISFVQALSAKASCLLRAGAVDEALACYQHAIERRRVKPNIETWAWLDFAWVVATRGHSKHYEEALGMLDEFGEARQLFPVITFRLHGSRALILSACGLVEPAAEAAWKALDAAEQESSGLRHHPQLGIVGQSYEDTRRRLSVIAATR